MLEVHEHRRILSGLRETQGRELGSHRREVDEPRRAWRRSREGRPDLHRAVLEGARAEMQEARRLHKVMLERNRWLLVVAERLQRRLTSR